MDRTRAKSWAEVSIGCSDSDIYRLKTEEEAASYLKILKFQGAESLLSEAERLRWLEGKLSVPKVLEYFQDDESGHEFLWISEISGVHAADQRLNGNLPDLMRLLAEGLHQIHNVNTADCPFHHELNEKVQEAEQNVQLGLVDEADFDTKRQGRTATDIFRDLINGIPTDEDLVFTHGDYCLPNVLVDDGRVSGFIDWGRAGVADRYRDIALAVRSITFNFGEEWADLFLNEYGLYYPDWAKIEWYQLLDEFF